MNFKDSLKRNEYNTLSFTLFSMHTLLFIYLFTRKLERGKGGKRRDREGDNKILKEKTKISCFHESF